MPEPRSAVERTLEQTLIESGVIYITWEAALANKFDLAITASPNGEFEKIQAPILLFQHGPALGKTEAYESTMKAIGRLSNRIFPTYICDPSSQDELPHVSENIKCVRVGDPTFDTILNSLKYRDQYRQALNVENKKLIVISSTWGPDSLLSNMKGLPAQLLTEFSSSEYSVAMILHPYIWAAHGSWQIKTWYKKELYAGLKIIPYSKGWEAAIIAADIVIGDYGSVTNYACAIGKQVFRYISNSNNIPDHIAITKLAAERSHPIQNGWEAVASLKDTHRFTGRKLNIDTSTFSHPGHSLEAIKKLCYSILNLGMNSTEIPNPIAELPTPIIMQNETYQTVTKDLADSENVKLEIDTYKRSTLNYSKIFDGSLIEILNEGAPNICINEHYEILVVEGKIFEDIKRHSLVKDLICSAELICIHNDDTWRAINSAGKELQILTNCPDNVIVARAIHYIYKNNLLNCLIQIGTNTYQLEMFEIK